MKKNLLTLLFALVALITTGRAQNKIYGHEYVDLGLPSGTLWATCNVGATKPEECGDYFAWGETEPKYDYSWENYKWCAGDEKMLTKYCYESSCGNNGFTDNKTELDLEDDAAYVNWGSQWRMPSYDQIKELIDNCTWTWTQLNGVNGYKVTSKKNGNSIFFPAAGSCYDESLDGAGSSGRYWLHRLSRSRQAIRLDFFSDDVNWNGGGRCYGHNIRPVVNLSATTVWHLVTDNDEQFPMSRVGMLVAVDESAYFSVLDINGNVLADEVLRVHFVKSDPVSVENLTTEKPLNILKRYVNNELTLVGAKGTINIYSADGVNVATRYATGQETIINVSSLPAGVYIVRCGNQSFKFNKK